MLEATIQWAVICYARERKIVCIKLTTAGPRGTTGWPDYMLVGPNRGVMFIEFKRPGKVLTPKQAAMAQMLQERTGFGVTVVDDVRGGKKVVDAFLQSCRYRRHQR